MKSLLLLAFPVFLFSQITNVKAAPAFNALPLEMRKQNLDPGQAVICNFENQCAAIRPPFNRSRLCTDLSEGSFRFLNKQAKNLSLSYVACTAYSDFGCVGTELGGDYSLTTPVIIDLTDWNGRNVSESISSVLCALL